MAKSSPVSKLPSLFVKIIISKLVWKLEEQKIGEFRKIIHLIEKQTTTMGAIKIYLKL